MSEMTYKCPFCGGEFIIEPEWGGMSVNCPYCQKSVKIGIALPSEEEAEEQFEEEGGGRRFRTPGLRRHPDRRISGDLGIVLHPRDLRFFDSDARPRHDGGL